MALSEVWLSSCRFAQKYCLLTKKSVKKSCTELHKNHVKDGQTEEHKVVAKKKLFFAS
jgi:hypothetical protein